MERIAVHEIGMMDIVKCVWPFLKIQFVCLMVVIFNPQIALWLPNQMIAK